MGCAASQINEPQRQLQGIKNEVVHNQVKEEPQMEVEEIDSGLQTERVKLRPLVPPLNLAATRN